MKNRSPITTHVLDTAQGKAAASVKVQLEHLQGGSWKELARGQTNSDGRVEDLLTPGTPISSGQYRLTFDTAAYFKSASFYPSVIILFQVTDPAQHYHVPLLLSPFGYSTYRGT